MNISRPYLYRIADKKGWESKFRKLPTGGRQKLYSLPDNADLSVIENTSTEVLEVKADSIPDLNPGEDIPMLQQEQAMLRAKLCETILTELSVAGSKTRAWKELTKAYNEGNFFPELFKLDGTHGERTFRR
ncbi:MAG: hypothetical protein K8S56_04660 [Candidatus Cloacimonetes bacterium]|nr:hypothetical protein [Candidatus Cloacimonadota bacterium]